MPSGNFHPDFLHYALSNRSARLPSLAGRAAAPIVNKANFADFLLSRPPLTRQKEIAGFLSATDENLSQEGGRKGALQALFKAMLQDLMAGKIRVLRTMTSNKRDPSRVPSKNKAQPGIYCSSQTFSSNLRP